MNDLDDLETLLAESVEQAQAKKNRLRAGELRDKLTGSHLKTNERQALVREFKAAELQYEWETIGLIAMTDRSVCQCGSVHEAFVGLYYRQTSLVTRSGRRMISVGQVADNLVGRPVAELPKSRIHRNKSTVVCVACLATNGFGADTDSNLLEIAK